PGRLQGLRRLLVRRPAVGPRPLGRPARAPPPVRLQLRPAAPGGAGEVVRAASGARAGGSGAEEAAPRAEGRGRGGGEVKGGEVMSNLGTLGRGVAAGLIGTACMTALQEASLRLKRH